MAIENDSSEAQAPVADLKYLFFSSTEWLKSFLKILEDYMVCGTKHLAFTASRLQEQADYAKALSECTDVAEALKYSAEFMQNAWKKSYSDGSKFFEAWREFAFRGAGQVTFILARTRDDISCC